MARSYDDDFAKARSEITRQLEKLTGTSLEREIEIGKLSDGAWLNTACKILEEAAEPFEPKNMYDIRFCELIGVMRSTPSDAMLAKMKELLKELRKQSEANYNGFVNYFARFPLWGTLDPANNDFDTLRRRAEVLKRHSYDFMWLYRRLEDYLSKRTLFAILLNWMILDFNELSAVKSIFPDYWEPDIFPDNNGDVLVDVGAYIGDSIANYVNFYGPGYKKIYAYEISEQSCEMIRKNLKSLPNIEVRCKGAGREAGEFYLNVSGSDPSANQISDNGSGQRVTVAALDDDIPDGFTFLKMDIEGAEFDALLGCERNIRDSSPNLAICVYHGYDDIWRIPSLIDDFNPSYRFYLRHNGGNLIPTEFVLLCKSE